MFEGFGSNRLQIRIQRNELHILTLVKIDFDDFCDFSHFCNFQATKSLKTHYSKAFEGLGSIQDDRAHREDSGKENKKTHHQKLIIFEGFSSNGLQIRIQRNELHILTPIKIHFDDFCDFSYFCLTFRGQKL